MNESSLYSYFEKWVLKPYRETDLQTWGQYGYFSGIAMIMIGSFLLGAADASWKYLFILFIIGGFALNTIGVGAILRSYREGAR